MAGEARMARAVLYIPSYMQECDTRHAHACAPVKWDSGNKPEIDNTYYVYNGGNDGLYHLALAEEVRPNPPATLPSFHSIRLAPWSSSPVQNSC